MAVFHTLGNKDYVNIPPQADTVELSKKYERVMFRHTRWGEPLFFIAPKNKLTSGYVIGLVFGGPND